MERQKFEEEWRTAFESGEKMPSESVWTNIELQLERESGGKMKRSLLMFQLLAAASLVFAMGIGSYFYLTGYELTSNSSIASNDYKESPKQEVDSNDDVKDPATEYEDRNNPTASTARSESANDGDDAARQDFGMEKSTIDESQIAGVKHGQSIRSKEGNNAVTASRSKLQTLVTATEDKVVKDRVTLVFSERPLPSLVQFHSPTLTFDKQTHEVDPGEALLAKLAEEELRYKEENSKKEKNTEAMWTALGFSAGTYDPGSSGSISRFNSSLTGTQSSGSLSNGSTPGSSYSVAVSVGGKLSDHLVVQGGIQYLTQNAGYISNSVSSENTVSLDKVSFAGDNQASAPYSVNSNMAYLSLPVQAGYMVLDRAFAIQVNGGLSTDLFLQSKLSSENSQFSDVSTGPGSDSPYRTVNFSGLVGTEFSYRFADHYRLALSPGLRYALNSIYKENVPASISPVTIDVAVRFKYIFSK